MGTSGSSGGPGNNTPLVPTWLDQPDDTSDSSDANSPQDGDQPDGESTARPVIPAASNDSRFQSARANFSRFASSGGNDRQALARGVSGYVRRGAGGAQNATRRMGAALATGAAALGVLRDVQRDGVAATLAQHSLSHIAGQSAQSVFTALTDVVCAEGGPVDEGIARDAWLETVTQLDSLGITSIDGLTEAQISGFFLSYVSNSIVGALYQAIGVNGFSNADTLSSIRNFDRQFRDYVRNAVRDAFSGSMANVSALSDRQIRTLVNQTYQDAWELLDRLGDS